MTGKPALRIVRDEPPARAKSDQFVFARIEGRLVAFHNGEECSIAEAVATVALIARDYFGGDAVPAAKPHEVTLREVAPEQA